MIESFTVQGRRLSGPDLELIRGWRRAQTGWSRWRLSRELAAHWDWRNEAGALKDMAARTLLLKLEQRGLIELPARRQTPTNRMCCPRADAGLVRVPEAPLKCALAGLEKLRVTEVSGQSAERRWVRAALGQFHYLGFGGAVGDYAHLPIMRSCTRSVRSRPFDTGCCGVPRLRSTRHNQRLSRKSRS